MMESYVRVFNDGLKHSEQRKQSFEAIEQTLRQRWPKEDEMKSTQVRNQGKVCQSGGRAQKLAAAHKTPS